MNYYHRSIPIIADCHCLPPYNLTETKNNTELVSLNWFLRFISMTKSKWFGIISSTCLLDECLCDSLALFRWSASSWSNGFDRPSTFRRSEIWCVLHVNDLVHGFMFPIRTPQCFSGSYSRSFTGNTFRFFRLPLPLPLPDTDVDVEIFDKLIGELLFDDELLIELTISENNVKDFFQVNHSLFMTNIYILD